MTDHISRRPSARAVLLAPAAAAVALLVGGCGDDGTDRASDTPSAAATTDSPSGAATASSTGATSSDATSSDPAAPSIAPGVDLDGAVKKAVKAKFPALIASRVPTGWTLTRAGFASGTWDLTFTTADGGTAGVTQSAGSVQDLLDRRLGTGATPAAAVDLSRYGTGTWDAFQGSGSGDAAFALTHAFHGTQAVVYAATQAEAETLAQQLLTAEDGTSPDGD